MLIKSEILRIIDKMKTWPRRQVVFWLSLVVFSILFLAASLTLIKARSIRQEIPRSGVIFVDQSSSFPVKNGSLERPFSTIQEALDLAEAYPEFQIVHIAPGEYREEIELPKNVTLWGDGASRPIISNPGNMLGRTIKLQKDNRLINLDIRGGRIGVFIPANAGHHFISGCRISNADDQGIYGEISENSFRSKINLFSSQIEDNGELGVYLQKGGFYSNNCSFSDNDEHGIDIRAGIDAVIKNCHIAENSDNGLKMDIEENRLTLENCLIEKNGNNGISLRSSGINSNVWIAGNTIRDNGKSAIRCSLQKRIKGPYFSKMVFLSPNNQISGNEPAIDPNCKL